MKKLTIQSNDQNPKALKTLKRIAYLALVVSLVNLTFVVVLSRDVINLQSSSQVSTTTTTLTDLTASGADPTAPSSLADGPIITSDQPAGLRLTNINAPFNQTELSVINNAPDSYFETAGEMFLNKSLANLVGTSITSGPLLVSNGKPAVIYLGANTCVFCGENRWAMALALGKFGNFSILFKGYSSLQDGDLPTVYWAPSHYNITQGIVFGSFFTSKYLSFISMEYQSPITQPVQIPSLSYLQTQAALTGSTSYVDAVDLIGTLNLYQGTPYTVWGKFIAPSADAQDFGNSSVSTSRFPLANLTHSQVLSHLAKPTDQFSWTEYAAADLYVAMACKTLGNTAPVCALNAIQRIEAQIAPSTTMSNP